MLSNYFTIAKVLRDKKLGINWIELDKGQLDSPEDFNSLIWPAVLISFPEIDWELFGMKLEQGEGLITIKTIFVLPTQTYDADPLAEQGLEVLNLADQVHDAMLAMPGIIKRTNSKYYPAGTYYVAEHTYRTVFSYGGPRYKTVPVALQINSFIYHPTAKA